jgi:hypothetical protein
LGRINRPGNCYHFAAACCNSATAFTTSRKNRVSHAARAPVDHDVFDCADFFALRRFHWLSDELARLNVARAAASRGLGLRVCRSDRQSQKGSRGSYGK